MINNAEWMCVPDEFECECPDFRRNINITGILKRAILSIACVGVYECRINGKKVGDEVLTPGWSNFNDHAFVREYPIRQYLDGLPEWDKTERVDTLLTDYLGAEDNPYTCAVIRKTLCGAIARVMIPGIKFDTMLVLSGPQGIGKSTIITKSISRFARNTVTLLSTVRELKELGVDVWFEKENIHSISGDGELMLTILASFAQEESLSVSENCKWRIRHNYEEGIPNNFQIYGYDMKNHKLTVNEEEAEVVRKIFEMYANGDGTYKIVDYLKAHHIKSPRDSQWRPNRIMAILRNEKYLGDLLLQKVYSENHITKRRVANDGVLKQYYVSENHAPIIDRNTFERVQKIISEKAACNAHVNPYEYDFKDMVFCGKCGDKYTRKKIHGGTVSEKYVWICRTYAHKGKTHCSNKQIPDEVLVNMAKRYDTEIEKILILESRRVQFIFADESEDIQEWEINRKWTDEMKERNYYNQRRRFL